MADLKKLTVQLGLDKAQYSAGLKGASSEAQKSTNKIQGSFENLAKGIAAGFTVGAVLQGIKSTIKAASDLNETVTKTSVIFGDSAGEIEKFASTAATSLGQSKKQAMDAASTFAIFGKAAGLSGQELVGFSTKLTTLSADFASFFNTSPEEAITSIGAALRGESEPIRKYGVLLNDASLRQKALEMGIISTIEHALTPQQRSLAAYESILDQTKDAQGDFLRTSDGLANSQRILTATTADLEAELGTAFLPTTIKVTKALTTAGVALGILLTWQEKVEDATQQGSKVVAAESKSYDEYTLALLDARHASGLLLDMAMRRYGGMVREGKSIEDQIVRFGGMTEAEYNAAKAVQKFNSMSLATPPAIRAMSRSFEELALSEEELKIETETLKLEQILLKSSMSDLSAVINGRLGPDLENYREKQRDLNSEAKNLRDEIDKLSSKKWLNAEQKAELEENRQKLKDIQDQIKANADEHDEATKRILLDMLMQRAAIDGLTTDEVTMITTVAEKWGLIDEASARSMQAADQAMIDLANGQGINETISKFETMSGLISGVAGYLYDMNGKQFTTYFDIVTSATNYHYIPPTGGGGGASSGGGGGAAWSPRFPGDVPGGARGLDMIVPSGYPNDTYPVRATSGERVTITPADEKNKAGLMIENVNMYITSPVANGEQLYREFKRRLTEDLRTERLRA